MWQLRLSLLGCVHAIVALGMVRVARGSDAFDMLMSLLLATATATLCVADSHVLGRPMVHAAVWVTFIFWPVAVPIYLIWSRGWRGVLVGLAHAGLLLVTAVVALVGAFVLFGFAER